MYGGLELIEEDVGLLEPSTMTIAAGERKFYSNKVRYPMVLLRLKETSYVCALPMRPLIDFYIALRALLKEGLSEWRREQSNEGMTCNI